LNSTITPATSSTAARNPVAPIDHLPMSRRLRSQEYRAARRGATVSPPGASQSAYGNCRARTRAAGHRRRAGLAPCRRTAAGRVRDRSPRCAAGAGAARRTRGAGTDLPPVRAPGLYPRPAHLRQQRGGLRRAPGSHAEDDRPDRWLPRRQPGLGLAAADRGQRGADARSEEHTSELQSREKLVCRLLLEKKKRITSDVRFLRYHLVARYIYSRDPPPRAGPSNLSLHDALPISLRICGSSEEASDVLQEAMLKMIDRIGDYRGDSPFWGWLRQIAVNEALM